MHEALCRPSDTTLDILHVERRAADHSANMGSRGLRQPKAETGIEGTIETADDPE